MPKSRHTRRVRRIRNRNIRKRNTRHRGGSQKFSVSYSGIPVKWQRFTKEQTEFEPQVEIPEGHYVVMADLDAVNPECIHWIVTPTRDILQYMGPSPPPGSGIHRYVFLLVPGNPPPAPKRRCGQDIYEFAPNPIAYTEFTVSAEN